MIEQDTIRLLRECDAGVKMGVSAIDEVLGAVRGEELKQTLFRCREEHEKLGREQQIQLVTTLRQNALRGLVSKESPVGRALLGHRAGERVEVVVSPELKYAVEIRSVEPGEDDESLEISSY